MNRTFTIALACLLLSLPLAAQRRHDPLNNKEIDQLRDTAQQPEERIKLLVKFARARMESLEKLRADAKTPDGSLAMQLEDFADLIDEMDVNLDSYNQSSADLRKALREVIAANTEFQAKLRAMAQSMPEGRKSDFAIALDSALDSVSSSGCAARTMLAQQIERKGQEKEEAKKKSAKDKHADEERRKQEHEQVPPPMSEKPPL